MWQPQQTGAPTKDFVLPLSHLRQMLASIQALLDLQSPRGTLRFCLSSSQAAAISGHKHCSLPTEHKEFVHSQASSPLPARPPGRAQNQLRGGRGLRSRVSTTCSLWLRKERTRKRGSPSQGRSHTQLVSAKVTITAQELCCPPGECCPTIGFFPGTAAVPGCPQCLPPS